MMNYLKVLTIELKSAQSIIKILLEELKVDKRNISGTSPSCENINPTESESESEWTEIRRKNHLTRQQIQTSGCFNYIEKHSSNALPTITRYTVPVANRFASFVNQHEPQEDNFGTSLHNFGQPPTYSSDRNQKNFKEPRRSKSSYYEAHM
jgi:hypothetical protein